MKKLIVLATLALSACGNLSEVSDKGTTTNPQFPKISESVFNHDGSQFGSWVNWDNVRQIERGMNKDQIYNLIGRPHFAEGLYGVREWDYVFNYRENGEHKVCQYKILFDKNMNSNETYWLPKGCGAIAAPYNLSTDFLFDFDKDSLTQEGIDKLKVISQELLLTKNIHITGYTDRLGSHEYNFDLSARRANTIRDTLVANGITGQITTEGAGETKQVKGCFDVKDNLKECLKPNRRVTIEAKGLLNFNDDIKSGAISP